MSSRCNPVSGTSDIFCQPLRNGRPDRRSLSLAANTLLGCLLIAIGPLPQLMATASDADELDNAAVPIFKDGLAQEVEGFKDPKHWLRHDLWVETEFDSDGDGKLDRVHVAVTRPGQTESAGLKLPVIYVSSPYFAGTAPGDREYFWDARHELGAEPPQRSFPPAFEPKGKRPVISTSHTRQWIPLGYIVVHSSSPGTGLSQGCPTVGGDNESLAPKAVIDWLRGRAKGYTEVDGTETVEASWCSGKIGMTGTSYNGTIPLAAATTGVEGLEVIIPVAPNTSYYHYYRSNGLVRHPGGWMGEDIDVLYDYIHSGNLARRDWCDCEVRDREMAENQDRISGDYNDFWAGRDYLNDLAPMRAAMLMAHAFNDWNVVPEHSIRIYEKAKEMGLVTHLFMHQGGHGGEPPKEMMNRWFTHYLHGIDNGIAELPKAYIVREDDARDKPTTYEDYPNPAAEPVTFQPIAGGQQQGLLTLSSPGPQGQESLVDNFSFSGAILAQAEWTNHRLLYSTPELSAPLHISGAATLRIRLAADRPAANLSVWLVSLPWNTGDKAKITENIITRGWADPQNSKSIRESEPLVPGQFYDLSFQLQPDDQIIPAGQRIGLMIFSSDKDFTLHPDPGTQLTIDLDQTSLQLPIVGGQSAYEAATAVAP
ncbi:Xaa-Pro dipeptidyl-peptidase [Planctomycetaceae bacterium SH139]